jgi:hypothetical protein
MLVGRNLERLSQRTFFTRSGVQDQRRVDTETKECSLHLSWLFGRRWLRQAGKAYIDGPPPQTAERDWQPGTVVQEKCDTHMTTFYIFYY